MRLFLLALAALASCSSDEMAAMAPRNFDDCSGNGVTVTFGVEPLTLARNADVSLTVGWEVLRSLNEPVATLRVGDGPVVEVEVPLVADPNSSARHAYRGLLVNPFGMGAPTGTVEVLAEAAPDEGCLTFATAASAFELE